MYTAALEPPAGFVLDQAIATTYSLDPATLLSVPVHLGYAGCGSRGEAEVAAVLEGLRRVAQRTTVYAHRGRMRVPSGKHALYGLLESMIVEVRAPNGGAFHPKLWVLRFVQPGSDEPPCIRLLVLSRNLTADRSWDLALRLDGRPRGSYVAANRSLGELIRDLPSMAVGTVAKDRVDQAALLGDELRRTVWELPAGFESLDFHVLGRKLEAWHPPRSYELAVVSPFVTDDAIAHLRKSTDKLVGIVSRPEELDALAPGTIGPEDKAWILDEAAVADDSEESADRDILGLHAKALVARCGWYSHVFVGSANATGAALLAGKNLEVLAELVGKWSAVGAPADILGEDGLGEVLVPYTPAPGAAEEAQEREAEEALESARDALAHARLLLSCTRVGTAWGLELQSEEAVPLPGISAVRCWPITIDGQLAADAAGLRNGEPVALGTFATTSVTGLLAFEVTAGAGMRKLTFGLNVPVTGMPEEREAAILTTVLRNRDGFLRYLMMLLGNMGNHAVLPEQPQAELGGRGRWSLAGFGTQSLLEDMTRAFARDPERLREVQRVVDRLSGTSEGRSMIPDDFLAVWEVFRQALDGRRQ
jgi:hypothetical protein